MEQKKTILVLHPYTQALLSAVPSANPEKEKAGKRIRLKGDPPSPINPPPGCRFASRCAFAEAKCSSEAPTLQEVRKGHMVRCHLVSN